jgi:RNA polymerase sigma-70 factor (ECF subfamily)
MHTEALVQWIPRLRRYARALTGDAAAADDLVQDTLARAMEKFSLWKQDSDLRAWLFTIMHNVFVNQVRSRERQTMQAIDQAELEAFADRPQMDGVIQDLAQCLQQVSFEQREVLLLVGLEEMSYEDVAEALGIPVGTVMSRLSRGRQRLLQLMNGTLPIEKSVGENPASLRIIK